jgi:hypothetical protein
MKIFENRNKMLESFPRGLKIAELGVFEGEFSKTIYEICAPKELILIDLFEGYFGSGDKDGNNYHYVQLEDEMDKLINYFSDNPEVKIIKQSTSAYLESILDNSLDMVYIDADHSYESVINDLRLSYKKVKYGGYICGHDYIYDAKNAIDHFCSEKNLEIICLTKDGCPSFCIQKKNDKLKILLKKTILFKVFINLTIDELQTKSRKSNQCYVVNGAVYFYH